VAAESERHEAPVDLVGADAAVRSLDELLDLGPVLVDLHRALVAVGRVRTRVADRHVSGHGLGVTARELRGGVRAAGEVEGFEDVHDLPVRLRHGPSWCG
jgi:hypothetical protein